MPPATGMRKGQLHNRKVWLAGRENAWVQGGDLR